MLPCNLRTWTKGEILLVLMSILTLLDVTATTSPPPPPTTANTVGAIVSTKIPTEIKSTTVAVHSSTIKPSSAPTSQPAVRTHGIAKVSEPTSTTLVATTTEPRNQTSPPTQVTQGMFTTQTTEGINSRNLTAENSENATSRSTDPTTQSVQTTKIATTQRTTSLIMQTTQATVTTQGNITCLGLGNLTSTSQVVCFQYEEETSCKKLDNKMKEKLQSFLCEIMSTTTCNVTVHASEVQPRCILWVPTSKDAKDRLQNQTQSAMNQLRAQMQWGQISDHQTRSQKTMIALVTCGVLLAAFILAGYFLSNRESWSPGRQRLGEDPYCTETDSQGNTLVSVSSHPQEKPNTGTQENGTGQSVSPAATNGHSTKKQNVSDTEL